MQTIFDYKPQKTVIYAPKASLYWKIGTMFSSASYDNLVLSTYGLNDEETVDIRKCFDGTNHIFVFGRSLQNQILEIQLLLLLGRPCDKKSKTLTIKELREIYEDNRILKTDKNPQAVQIGDLILNGFPIKLSVGPVDATNQTCKVTLTLIVDAER